MNWSKSAVRPVSVALPRSAQKNFLPPSTHLEGRHLSVNGSGVREIHRVFTQLESRASQPTFALANRRIFFKNRCEIWSLSPDDSAIRKFLQSVGTLFPGVGQVKNRIPSFCPNEAAVALWVEVDDVGILLGSDLEKKGWIRILQNPARPPRTASIFKVPHHGSKNAHVSNVWKLMMEPELSLYSHLGKRVGESYQRSKM